MKTLRFMCPNGHLGFAPIKEGSFRLGVTAGPDFILADSGSDDMSQCRYEQIDAKTTRITGPRFIPAEELRVKLEGAGKIGERFIGLAGVRDPYTIANIDQVIGWAREQVRERFGDEGYNLYYNVFGRNGVMSELEPFKDRSSHELCVVVQGVADTKEMAEEVCMTGTRQMFYARLPEVKGTAGQPGLPLDIESYSGC